MAARPLVLVAVVGVVACKGGGDATPVDGGGVDASTTLEVDAAEDDAAVGPVTCADATLLFCEDFESLVPGAASSASWTTETSGGSLTIDAVHARGTQALHVHTTGSGRARLQVPSFAPPDNSFFGRMHVWVTAFPTAPDYAHFTLVEAAGATPGYIRPIGGQFIPAPAAGRSLWGTGSDGGATGDWTNWQVSAPAEDGRWICLEWQLAAADNEIHVWIDGVAHPELDASTQMHGGSDADFVFPSFTSLWFGWWLYQGGTTPAEFDLWLDDLAVSSSRIGC